MDPLENILIMSHWKEQGCPICRHQWESGDPPPAITFNMKLHSSLHRCQACGTYWEQTERYAAAIALAEAVRRYPDADLRMDA